MKLFEWFKARSGQELMMIAVVAMLLVMIATRWAYISRTAKEAIPSGSCRPPNRPTACRRNKKGKLPQQLPFFVSATAA